MKNHTYTAETLPVDAVKKDESYQLVNGVWFRNNEECCSKVDNTKYMTVSKGGLYRTQRPNICGNRATTRMVKSQRAYCEFHVPPTGERVPVFPHHFVTMAYSLEGKIFLQDFASKEEAREAFKGDLFPVGAKYKNTIEVYSHTPPEVGPRLQEKK